MTRRTSREELAFARGKIMRTRRNMITQGTGPFKDYDLRISCQWAHKVEAYGVGDIAAVGLLLNQVSALGKLTRNGWGSISDMQIAFNSEAQEKWCYRTLPSVFERTEWHYPAIASRHPTGSVNNGCRYGNLGGVSDVMLLPPCATLVFLMFTEKEP